MKVVAIVKEVCPIVSGTSDNGNDWEKQQIVVETCDIEPKTLAIDFMGERKTKGTKTLRAGDRVEVSFGIRCNEYMGKWYTRLEGGSCTLMARAENRELAAEDTERVLGDRIAEHTEEEMPPSGDNDLPFD